MNLGLIAMRAFELERYPMEGGGEAYPARNG